MPRMQPLYDWTCAVWRQVQTLGEAMDCATGAQRKAEQAIDKVRTHHAARYMQAAVSTIMLMPQRGLLQVVARQRENKQANDAIDEVLTSFEWTPL